MRIVNIEDYFIPDAGYQINILPKYLSKMGHEVFILTSIPNGIDRPSANFLGIDNLAQRDEMYSAQTGVTIIRVKPAIKYQISNRIVFGRQLFNTLKKLNPDVLFVHGNDTLTGIRILIKRTHKYAVVADSHMLPMASNNRFNRIFYKLYSWFVTPRIIKNRIPIIRTQDDDFVNKCLNIPQDLTPWISYGSDLSLFYPDRTQKTVFLSKHQLPKESFVVIYAGKIDANKGGELLAKSFQSVFTTKRPIVLLLVGNFYGDYGERVQEMLFTSQNPVVCYPTQKYLDLPKYFQAADIAVFPKQSSLSFYDVQACGLPVITEDNNINESRLNHGNGLCFQSNNPESLRIAVEYLANLDCDKFQKYSENALKYIRQHYDYADMARKYLDILVKEYNRYKKTDKE